MSNLLLTGEFVARSKYKGSSKFSFWQNIVPGDILYISIEIKNPGKGRQPYAPQLHICNKTNDIGFQCSLVELTNYLEKVDILRIGA